MTFSLSNTSVTILDGQSSGQAMLTILDDALVEALVETATVDDLQSVGRNHAWIHDVTRFHDH